MATLNERMETAEKSAVERGDAYELRCCKEMRWFLKRGDVEMAEKILRELEAETLQVESKTGLLQDGEYQQGGNPLKYYMGEVPDTFPKSN